MQRQGRGTRATSQAGREVGGRAVLYVLPREMVLLSVAPLSKDRDGVIGNLQNLKCLGLKIPCSLLLMPNAQQGWMNM